MKLTTLLLALVLATGSAWAVKGSMSCKVTGNVVVASEEGKFKQYAGFKDDVQQGDELKLEYEVLTDSVEIELAKMDRKPVSWAYAHQRDAKFERSQNGGIVGDDKLGTISLFPDYMRTQSGAFGELRMWRYYKSDWHGLYMAYGHREPTGHSMTIDCRHTNDQIDAALKEFKLAPTK